MQGFNSILPSNSGVGVWSEGEGDEEKKNLNQCKKSNPVIVVHWVEEKNKDKHKTRCWNSR